MNLKCNINYNENHLHEPNNQNTFNLPKTKWKESKKNEFIAFINSYESQQCLQKICTKLDNLLDNSCINECIEDLCNVFKNAGESHVVNVNTKNHLNHKSCIWYDSECREKKNIFHFYEKRFHESGTDVDRLEMCKARNTYRKFCRNKRKKHQIDKAQELYDLSKTNPAHFWSKIKSKKHNTGNCDFYSHFKKII